MSEISKIDPLSELIGKYQIQLNQSGEISLFANTNMADTRIICPICTVILSRSWPDLVA